jgi:copper(I)-binding protein
MRSLKFRVVLFLAMGLPLGCAGEVGSGLPDLQVDDPWARATPLIAKEAGGLTNSAVYLLLRNMGSAADRLLGAESYVSNTAELHESRLEDGVMRMRRVEDLIVPSGGEIALRPGGYHLMLLNLNQPLTAGDTVTLFLEFEHSGRMEVLVPVRPLGGA